jgi:hypothetical protein
MSAAGASIVTVLARQFSTCHWRDKFLSMIDDTTPSFASKKKDAVSGGIH